MSSFSLNPVNWFKGAGDMPSVNGASVGYTAFVGLYEVEMATRNNNGPGESVYEARARIVNGQSESLLLKRLSSMGASGS